MGAVVGSGGDLLVGLHVDADAQDALRFLGRLAERITVRRRGDADTGKGKARPRRTSTVVPSRAARRREKPDIAGRTIEASLEDARSVGSRRT